MIESLVEQIEARFQDAQAQMSDPEVIGDRERYAEAGRLFQQLSSRGEARRGAGGTPSPTPRARGEMLAEGGDDPELRAEMEAARATHGGARRRRSGSRWSSATPTTTRT